MNLWGVHSWWNVYSLEVHYFCWFFFLIVPPLPPILVHPVSTTQTPCPNFNANLNPLAKNGSRIHLTTDRPPSTYSSCSIILLCMKFPPEAFNSPSDMAEQCSRLRSIQRALFGKASCAAARVSEPRRESEGPRQGENGVGSFLPKQKDLVCLGETWQKLISLGNSTIEFGKN